MATNFQLNMPWLEEGMPLDSVPYDSALKRLLEAGVVSDDSLSDYGLGQALRGLCFAVKSSSQVLKSTNFFGQGSSQFISAHVEEMRVKGREAVFNAMCLAAQSDLTRLSTIAYLSTRLLCDDASSFGEGNERPSCTQEWTQMLLLRPSARDADEVRDCVGIHADTSSSYAAHFEVNRRAQLGYMQMLGNTLRLVATGQAPRRHLFTDHLPLVDGLVKEVLPRFAQLAEGQGDAYFSTTCDNPGGDCAGSAGASAHVTVGYPSCLSVEANHFVLHSVHWLCVDVLALYESNRDGSARGRRVLDRDAPLVLWRTVTLLRNALQRALRWIRVEMEQFLEAHAGNSCAAVACRQPVSPDVKNASPRVHLSPAECSLPDQVSRHLDKAITAILKHQEELHCARTAAGRMYGESSKGYAELSEVMWVNTLQLCILLRDLTGAWMAIHGGLGIGVTAVGMLLQHNRDVVTHIGSCVAAIPNLQDCAEGKAQQAQATHALLVALLSLAAAAPLRRMQASVWLSDVSVTQQIHGVLVQRALSFRDEHILQMTSILAGSILYGGNANPSLHLSSGVAEQLLYTLSESRDAAAHYTVEIITAAVVQKPHVFIPSLFRQLERGTPQARRNVLDVLAALPKAASPPQTLDGSASRVVGALSRQGAEEQTLPPESGKMREVLKRLAENLLLHLHDDELALRMQSSALFAKVWPEDVIEPLLNLSLQHDSSGRKQSAAMSGLLAVVQAHTTSADVILLLIQDAFHIMNNDNLLQEELNADVNMTEDTLLGGEHSAGAALQWAPPLSLSPPFFSGRVERVPATPGDILSQALLYSSDSFGESAVTALNPSAEEADPVTRGVAVDCVTRSASSSGTLLTPKKKLERLAKIVAAVSEGWACAVEKWLSQAHLTPLLQLLSSAQGLGVEAQQWYLRCVTHLFSCLTQRGAEGALRGNVASTHNAILEAIYDTFFFEHGGQAGVNQPQCDDTWLDRLRRCGESIPSREASGGAAYHVVVPLLCLRSCARQTFVGATRLSGSRAPEEAIWCVLWHALFDKDCAGFFSQYRDAQRLLLEVLCKYPASIFFDRLCAEKESRTASCVFVARVAVFGLCTYLALFIASSTPQPPLPLGSRRASIPVDRDDNKTNASFPGADLKTCTGPGAGFLFDVLQNLVVPWLLSDSPADNAAADDLQPMQRLSLSVFDALSLLTLTCLCEQRHEDAVWTTCAQYTYDPIKQLAEHYRKHEKTPPVPETGGKHEKPSAALTLERDNGTTLCMYEISMQVQRLILRHLQSFPHQGSRVLLVRWLTIYLRPLIELSNAVCASPCSHTERHFHFAVQCAELIFQAIMVSTKMHGTPTHAGSSSQQTTVLAPEGISSSPLQQLVWADQEAMVRFSLGCTRYIHSLQLQQVGVRILSALLSAAPEMLIGLPGKENASVLDEALSTLQSISLMHPDARTRHLAGQVVGVFQ